MHRYIDRRCPIHFLSQAQNNLPPLNILQLSLCQERLGVIWIPSEISRRPGKLQDCSDWKGMRLPYFSPLSTPCCSHIAIICYTDSCHKNSFQAIKFERGYCTLASQSWVESSQCRICGTTLFWWPVCTYYRRIKSLLVIWKLHHPS